MKPCCLPGSVLAMVLLVVGACELGERSAPNREQASAAQLAAAKPVSTQPKSDAALLPRSVFDLDFPNTRVGPMKAWVVVPERREGERFPLLVAMHGRGEALKGVERGARGWIDDYGLLKALDRLEAPPLTANDFEGFVDRARLAAHNRRLASRPYAKLVIVMPYTPTSMGGEAGFRKARALADFVADDLVPAVDKRAPTLTERWARGIDGVSLGGRAALLAGFSRPEAFASIGALQAAFDRSELDELAQRAKAAQDGQSGLRLRLLTSNEDYFLSENRLLSGKLKGLGVKHDLVVIPGPHDYAFNRGPGVYEMLLFHDDVLRPRQFSQH